MIKEVTFGGKWILRTHKNLLIGGSCDRLYKGQNV